MVEKECSTCIYCSEYEEGSENQGEGYVYCSRRDEAVNLDDWCGYWESIEKEII